MSKKKRKPSPVSKPTKDTKTKPIQVDAMRVFAAEAKMAAKVFDGSMTVDGYDNFASRLGLNNNNTLSAGTYEFNLVTRNRIKLEAAYRGSWIVGVVIDSVAEDMTRAGVAITSGADEVDLQELKRATSRLQISQSLCTNTKWGRLYGGSIAVIQIEGQDPSTPLDLETIKKDQFRGLIVYDRWLLNPSMIEVIDSGPEIGLPKFYQVVTAVTSGDPKASPANGSLKIHHSRVIRSIGILLPFMQAITEMMWGESVLERLWDRLISFDNATMSSASLIDRANLRMIGIEGLREIIGAGGAAQEGLLAQFEMMRSLQVNEGLTLLDKNDVYASTAYSFAGLSDMMLQFGQQLAGASGVPLVRLFGQSPAGLSSTGESDIRMYYDNINSRQESSLRNAWEIILKVLWRSVYGKNAPDNLDFNFVPLWQMSALDKATVAKTETETIIGAFEVGLVTKPTAMKELRGASGDNGLFSNITDEDIKAADEEDPPMAEPAGTETLALPTKPDDAENKNPEKEKTGDAGFSENKHPRKDNGEFGSGGSGSSSSIESARAKMKSAHKEAKRAKQRADTAPDRHEENPKSMQLANKKIAEYNEAANAYNSLLDKSKTGDSKFKWLKLFNRVK